MTPPPSVNVLLSDRLEARELCDDLAAVLDAIGHKIAHDNLTTTDFEVLDQAVQRWHERSWAP